MLFPFIPLSLGIIFSRLDPGEKLVIGCRKATIYAETQKGETEAVNGDAKSDRLKQLLKETKKYLQKFGSAEPLKQIMESRCRYLKISEKTSATRSTIIVPFNGISWFFDIFNYYVTSDDQDISRKELQLDSQGSFFKCFTLTLGKTGGVGFSRNH
ncbi:unnamed protein product [Lactuca saligna]|uniref:Uncharacterized protein n=1 Tax=Lactuca saligna TaxID=75948 RepID=A0AA35ZMX7_LACSI|nr:unnamed protein product [Lactuca saligna]